MTARHGGSADSLDAARLVERAAAGDGLAWEGLVEQYSRLIWAVTHDFKLVESDAADVAQVTWLRLLEHINRIEYPERVGSWLATTARHECLRNLAARKRIVLASEDDAFEAVAMQEPDIDEGLLAAERAESVRDALSCLPRRWQQLLQLLMADPPVSYTEISDQLGLPVGSIGPTRARCLARLRRHLQASEGQPPPKKPQPQPQDVIPAPRAVEPPAAAGLSRGDARLAPDGPASESMGVRAAGTGKPILVLHQPPGGGQSAR